MGRKKVLIADDVKLNRKFIRAIFDNRYEIAEASNGLETINLLSKSSNEFDILLLDLNMPVMNGFEVLDYLKENGILNQLLVIVITGSAEEEDEIHAFNSGATEIVRKPIVPEVLMRRIENLMELVTSRKLLSNQLKIQASKLESIQKNDHVTGLFNIHTFFSEVDKCIQGLNDEEIREYVLLYGNIRNFKYYNMNYGMNKGDEVIRNYAQMVTEKLPSCISGRYGQDHIVTLMKDMDVEAISAILIEEFTAAYSYAGMQLKLGAYHFEEAGEHAAEACEFAKIACDSIRNYTDNYCEYSKELSRNIEISTYILQHIDEAIDNHYIKVYYQPVVRTINHRVCSMEALSRWIDPKYGFLSPAQFIPTLENNQLITKLDLYILEEICKELSNREKADEAVVPISINLSRVDFEEVDICEEIEKIAAKYRVPRDLIKIEITESTLLYKPSKFKQTVKQLRNLGYDVWMDDFGSNYSSLNVLKDYEFDEIKLDMAFLSSFDNKSKNIVKSIVNMAKNIGIQTVAEGVETEEQYEFLRNIGCEKIQGYIISKPLPIEEVWTIPATKVDNIESRRWRKYSDAVSSVNLITDRALALIEWDGEHFNYVYINKIYEDALLSTGVTKQQAWDNMNIPDSPLRKMFVEFKDKYHLGEPPKDLIYSVRDCYIKVSASCIAENEEHIMFKAELSNLSIDTEKKQKELLDRVASRMFGLFDSVFLADLNKDTVETILLSKEYEGSRLKGLRLQDAKTIDEAVTVASNLIHPMDRDEFLKFVDKDTVKERAKESKHAYLTKYFRTLNSNGGYIWKAHSMLYLYEYNMEIYVSRSMNNPGEKLVQNLLQEAKMNNTAGREFKDHVIHSVMESNNINVFWKDNDRRFIGANECFLNTYGFSSVSEILGKTDEEMGWHIDNGPFANDEERILKNGDVITSQLGTCLIKGVAHNIIVYKEPIYEAGEIVGLMGCFIDAEALSSYVGDSLQHDLRDNITGLMTPHSFMNATSQYVEQWEVNGQRYARIDVLIPEYKRSVKSYGETAAREMLRELGNIISDEVGIRGTCARIYSANFMILMHYEEEDEVRGLADNILNRIKNIKALSDRTVTLHPEIDIRFADEEDNLFFNFGTKSI